MKTLLSWLVVVTIAVGALLLRFSFVYGGERNWVPVSLPFPGGGFLVNDWFTLPSGGDFEMKVIAPASDVEKTLLHREQPPVTCKLTLVVTGPSGFRSQRSIDRLKNGGWTRDTTIYFPEEPLTLPSGGQYTISLSNRGPAGIFSDRGALVQLTRSEPSGHELLYPLARFMSYGCFLFAGIGTLFILYRRPS